jgi:RNA polymerase sigma-70 factor (ECF subfamily)
MREDGWKSAANVAMDRYAEGDDGAFAVLYDLVAPRIHAFLSRRVCGDQAKAEDLVQQTFLQMHGARRHYVRGGDVMPWAFAIARRLLIDGIRARRREVPLDVEDEARLAARESRDAPDAALESKELAERFQRVIAALPEPQRTAFELVKYDGLSIEEAAAALGTTRLAVKLRVHRTYEVLRAAQASQSTLSRCARRPSTSIRLDSVVRAIPSSRAARATTPPAFVSASRMTPCSRSSSLARSA